MIWQTALTWFLFGFLSTFLIQMIYKIREDYRYYDIEDLGIALFGGVLGPLTPLTAVAVLIAKLFGKYSYKDIIRW